MIYIEKFMEWLNEEIKAIEITHNNPGKESEAIRIRAKLCEMDAHDKYTEDQIGAFCKKNCKFYEAYGDREEDIKRRYEERCIDCPVERLTK